MKPNFKNILRRSKQGTLDEQGRSKVLVALNVREPTEACLDRLKELGLSIDRLIENKIVGSIAPEKLDKLQGDPDVAEAELSVPLKPHRSDD